MARNNQRRTKAAPKKEAAPAPENPVASLLDFVSPTEFVDLPSQGRFYPEDHPFFNQKTIEIRYMTAKDEDILTSPALLKEGVAIARLLANIVVDKSININSLLVGDKNALIIAARITGYGADYTTNVTCPGCRTASEHSFELTLDNEVYDNAPSLDKYNASQTEDGTFVVQLPLTKAEVECRLLTGKDELKLMKESQRKAKRKMEEAPLTDQLKTFIVSGQGDSNPLSVTAFVHAMPAKDSRYLRTFYSDITPSVAMTQIFECSSCGYSADMEVPLTADFFWPKR